MQETNSSSIILLDYKGTNPTAHIEKRPEIKVENELILPTGLSVPNKNFSSKTNFIVGSIVNKIESIDDFFKRVEKEMSEFYSRVEKIQLLIEKRTIEKFYEQGKERVNIFFREKHLLNYMAEYISNDTSEKATSASLKRYFMNFSKTLALITGEELKEETSFSLDPNSKILMTNTNNPWYNRKSHTYTGLVNFSISADSSKPLQSDVYKLEARVKIVSPSISQDHYNLMHTG